MAHHSGRPRCLKHELSSLARTLELWVRIPLKAWMSVCVYSLFVLSCVQVAALRRADPSSKKSYLVCIGSKNWKSGQGPTKGCRAIIIIICPEIKVLIFLDLTWGSLVYVYQCLRETCFFYLEAMRRDKWDHTSTLKMEAANTSENSLPSYQIK
jgi:hypothetical protein